MTEHGSNIPQKTLECYGYSSLPHQPPGFSVHNSHQFSSSAASNATSDSTSFTSTEKRGRGEHDETTNSCQDGRSIQTPSVGYEESPVISSTPQKKARSSTYEAPRAVKTSILTAMGTLASSGAPGTIPGGSVPLRRRLSGGHLEEFMGTQDLNMEMDTSESRPRSMSF